MPWVTCGISMAWQTCHRAVPKTRGQGWGQDGARGGEQHEWAEVPGEAGLLLAATETAATV